MSTFTLRTHLLELMNDYAYLSDEVKGQLASNLGFIVRQQHKNQKLSEVDPTAIHLVLGSDEQGGFYMTFFDDGYKIKGKKVSVRHKAMHGLSMEVEEHIGAFVRASEAADDGMKSSLGGCQLTGKLAVCCLGCLESLWIRGS
jgi:hypothetical protein